MPIKIINGMELQYFHFFFLFWSRNAKWPCF